MFHFYFYDHITSWIMIAIQCLALSVAIYGYLSWQKQADSKSKNALLIEIQDLATSLKNSILTYDEIINGKRKVYNLMSKTSSSSDLEREYKLYKESMDIYNEHISNLPISLKTKSEMVLDIYDFSNLSEKIELLNQEAKKRRQEVMGKEVFDDQIIESKKSKVEKIFDDIRNQIKQDSPFQSNNSLIKK